MKKFLTLAVLLLVIVMCFALTSCGGVGAGDLQKNPHAVLDQAIENTANNFFAGDAVYTGISGAINAGSIEAAMGDESVTIYIDQANGKYGFEGDIDGDKLTATINNSIISIKDEGALGLDEAYTLDLEKLLKDFPNTNIGEMSGISEKEWKEYKEMVDSVLAQYKSLVKEGKITADSMANIVFANLLDGKVTTENVKVGDTTVKCVVATYKINAKTLEKTLNALVDECEKKYSLDKDMVEELEEGVEDALEELSEVDFDATIKLCLNAKANSISLIEIKAEVKDMASVKASISASDTEIAIEGEMEMNGEKASAEISIEKKAEKGETTYTLKGEATMGNATLKFLNGKIKTTKDKLTLSISACDELDIPEISFTAKLTTGKSVKIQPSSLKVDGEEIPMGEKMTITFTPGAKVPEIKGEDILKLSEDELEELLGKLERLF